MNDNLQYRIVLRTKSPVFVGSGDSFTKKEYLFDRNTNRVAIIDGAKLMKWLVKRGGTAIDEYERFMLGGDRQYLRDFFRKINITPSEEKSLHLYETDASEAIPDNGTLMEIKAFTRDAYNRPYVPGSSLKGALRTIILVKMLRDDQSRPPLPDDMSKKYSAAETESRYLNTLRIKNKVSDALNSVMRGVSISDSAPLGQESMALARKVDRFRDGGENALNVARECARPGTDIRFLLAINPRLCGPVNAEFITSAVSEFGDYYKTVFSDKFTKPSDDIGEAFEDCILLGGGCGYFSKNIVYPGRPWSVALKRVSEVMQAKFRKHNHGKDVTVGISPRAIKYTEYRAGKSAPLRSYHFGVCHFSIERSVNDKTV